MIVLFVSSFLFSSCSSDKCSKENAEKKLKSKLSDKGYDVKSCECYRDFSNDCEYGFHVILLRDNEEKGQKEECRFDYIIKKTMSGEWVVD